MKKVDHGISLYSKIKKKKKIENKTMKSASYSSIRTVRGVFFVVNIIVMIQGIFAPKEPWKAFSHRLKKIL